MRSAQLAIDEPVAVIDGHEDRQYDGDRNDTQIEDPLMRCERDRERCEPERADRRVGVQHLDVVGSGKPAGARGGEK